MKKSGNLLPFVGIGAIIAYLAVRAGEKILTNITDKKTFKLAMQPVAAAIDRDFGIKGNILMAQAALESGWGKSGLTVSANNLFGFTGESWQKAGKPVILMDTREYINGAWKVVKRPFRSYNSWYDSAKDWATTLNTLSRYKNALIYAKTGDLPTFASEIKAAGYATDPNYPNKLIAFGAEVDAIKIDTLSGSGNPDGCANFKKI